ncbi:aminotransferase class I/II-fold pyridoxal phosphate-dependent enzyme [Salmonella enterica]|nr:aminotransferase class I/II-fold pyridoxal phosphate-dependent enzyme [Salmonella enterica subsp. enterica serovar Tennessee]EIA9363521.1 aminotransferase class I/II-fold pyridoxal phosphate-dependent enzyme [Salmonella enterica]HDP0188642.1 aminotransferase class I/II-fold pyridoxal phosphate-dependent enzyme [Salmonella enterica subsp. enterica serovar Concord]
MKYDFNETYQRTASEKWEYDSVINGFPVIPMSVADTDLVSPVEVRQALIEVCNRREFGYPAYHDDFKDVLASWYERYYNWRPDTADIIETPPLLMTMGAFIRGMTQCNESVVVMTPVYHSFARTIRENHRAVTECDLLRDEKNHYTIDFEKLEDTCSRPENKILIFCNPHNPVGRCWTGEEVRKVAAIAQKTGTILISDEIHADFVYDEKCYTPVMKAAENLNGIIVFSSGGKLFNIGGIFSSYVFTADPEVVNHIRKMQIKLVNGLNNMPYPVKANLPEATYLVWADFNDTGWSGDRIQEFLVQDAGLGFNRGDQFGVAGTGFARINCGVPESRIDEALSRLEKAFSKYF